MNKICITMENCFGIKSLKKEFDFTNPDKKAYVIYASNGTMKTSFAKTIKNYSEGKEPAEEIFGRSSKCTITKSTGAYLPQNELFVIQSYDEGFQSKKVSNLLVNEELQTKYSNILQDIEEKKDEFITKIKELIGSKIPVETEICQTYGKKDSDFLGLLSALIKEGILSSPNVSIDFSKINYLTIFNDKVVSFIKEDTNYKLLLEYSNIYNTLVENSTFLKKAVFSHYNAESVNENLSDNGFYQAEHQLILKSGQIIQSKEELTQLIDKEKKEILSDTKLKKSFSQIDKKLSTNAQLRSFRSIIEQNPEIVSLFINFEEFKKKIWTTIFKSTSEFLITLVNEFNKGAKQIQEIINQANSERTEWENVMEIFKNRFSIPFELSISNQYEVILKNSVPVITFKYTEEGEKEKEIERGKLYSILSGGEKRALYLLNIIFEIEALKRENKPVVIVADDIAESFDYKNKYAIIEYLIENIQCGIFNFIILTHNFDFYRTVGIRILKADRRHCLMVIKHVESIEFINGEYLKNIFGVWKNKIENDDSVLIASIPFIRNIVEYIDSDDSVEYKTLTSLLHLRDCDGSAKTKEITFKQLETIINDIWRTQKKIASEREEKKVFDLILSEASNIASEAIEDVKLEKKIVLSMAIRLIAEEYMINEIFRNTGDYEKIKSISGNQTGVLLSLYKDTPGTNREVLKILEQVSLITPENIHLNSFMYEPLIDISIGNLKPLFSELYSLLVC